MNKGNNENDSYLVLCNNILKLLFDIDTEDFEEDNSFGWNNDDLIKIEKNDFSSNEDGNIEETSISKLLIKLELKIMMIYLKILMIYFLKKEN